MAAIERSENVTVSVLEGYVAAMGMGLEITVLHDSERTTLVGRRPDNNEERHPSHRTKPL
ncbi:MAG: hypothetical protein M0Z92_04300 [Actinomycetota bacterium]|nr:hypothetical protein [Actinomycetota bacterium]